MIDHISMLIPGGGFPSSGSLEPTPQGYIKGTLRNMRMRQHSEGIICQGSIAKFLHGHNLIDLTRKGCLEALGELERETGWNLEKAQVWGLEVGYNFIMENLPDSYLSHWGTVPRMTKNVHSKDRIESVTFSTKGRGFIGYDKAREIQAKKDEKALQIYHRDFTGASMLRLELKYKKGMRARFGQILSPWDIVERTFYEGLINKWKVFYFGIPKNRTVYLDAYSFSPKTLERALASKGLEEIGQDRILGIVSGFQAQGKIDKQTGARTRALLRDLKQKSVVSYTGEYAEELNEKVLGVWSIKR